MNSSTVKSLQHQLSELAKTLPTLQDRGQAVGQLYSIIMETAAQLSAHTDREELILKTVAALTHLSGEIIDAHEVGQSAVKIIHDNLGLHFVGLFLLDETNEWAESGGSVGESSHDRRIAVESELTVSRTIRHRTPLFTQTGSESGAGSELVLPLISRGQISGALVLQSTPTSIFHLQEEDGSRLQYLADQLANMLHSINLFTTVNRHLQQIITLHNINLQIGSEFDLEALLANVALLGTKLMGADVGLISLADKDRKKLIKQVTYRPPDLSPAETAGASPAALLSDRVFASGAALLINHWPTHPLAAEADITPGSAAFIQAVLCVPLVLQGKAIGTLEVQSFSKTQAFNENDLYLLLLLTAQAAAAIENARLFTQAENNRRFLKTVIEHIPDPIFIKDRNHTLLEMNRANAEIIGRAEQELIGKTDDDFFAPELVAKFQQRDNEVFDSNRLFIAEDKTVWADGQEHIAFTRLIPIPDPAGNPEYLLGITHDVTERKAQEAERERLLAETAALYEGNRAVASALSERQVFEALFDQIRRQAPCEIAAYHFNLVEDEPLWAELIANWHKKNTPAYPVGTRFYLPENPLARLLTTQTPIFIDDVAADSTLSDAERESFGSTGFCSVALLPVATAGQALGVVLVYFTQPYPFSDKVKRLWLALTDQVGISLLNRQLIQGAAYRAVQIDTAAEVARAASSLLGLQELLNAAVALIRDRFELYYVGVFLVNEAREWAILRAGTGEAGRVQLARGHRLKIGGESMIGWAIQNRRPRIALDIGRDAVHFQNPDLPDTRSEMAFPLIHRNEVIGALTIQSTEQAAFSRADIIILQTMADQLAIAIENANLFTKAQESEATTRAILNAIPDLILRLSKDGTYLAVRGPAELPPILPTEIFTGKTIFDVLPAAVAQQHQHLINLALQSGEPQTFEYDFKVDDQTYQFESRIVVSGPEETLAILRDITERKQAEREILRRNEELAAVNRVTAAVTSALDVHTILRGAAREMVEIFEARRCGIALLSPHRQELSVVASHASKADQVAAEGIIIPVANNPSSIYVIETGKSLVVPQAYHNPMIAPIHDLLRELEIESVMIVPLLVRGEVIGTIGIDLDQPDRQFTPAEVALAETIAGQIASTIDNARLFEQMEATLRAREQVEKALRASEKQYRQLVESANSIILRLNPRGQVTFLNRFGERFFGFSQEVILGRPVVGTIVPETESSG
ncbi:MAG: GAF domain-containing protein, partial [Chloroflexota bacterium]